MVRARLEQARREALAGRFEALTKELEGAVDAPPTQRAAWTAMARTLRWMAGIDGPGSGREGATEALGSAWEMAPVETREVAVEAAGRRALASILRFDGPSVHAHHRDAQRMLAGLKAPTPTLLAQAAAGWDALAQGTPLADEVLAELEQAARRQECAELVVDVASLRGLSLAEAGAFDDALSCARRASRMGRTERLPQSEYLAGLTLARLRRLMGRPYLATRIASSLRSVAPLAWHDWVDWEVVMSCGESSATSGAAALAMQRLLLAATEGDRDAFGLAVDTARGHVGTLAFLRVDLERALTMLDPQIAAEPSEPAVAAWCDGTSAFSPPPFGLAGLNGPSRDDAGVDAALVIASPGVRGRRVLRVARGLASRLAEGRCLSDGAVGRTEGLVSALALLGPAGADDATLFREAYGFAYAPALHRGTFDVALHRARARVEQFGRIVRDDGRVRLEVERSFVVPDPRSTASADSRVLGRLAGAGQLSARDLAGTLGMPLRTVQDALRELVEGGACRRHREGRKVVYAIEDTTFRQPTLT